MKACLASPASRAAPPRGPVSEKLGDIQCGAPGSYVPLAYGRAILVCWIVEAIIIVAGRSIARASSRIDAPPASLGGAGDCLPCLPDYSEEGSLGFRFAEMKDRRDAEALNA